MKNGYKKKMEINRWLLKKNVSGEKKKFTKHPDIN